MDYPKFEIAFLKETPNVRSDKWRETSIFPVFSKLKWWERLIGRDPKFKGFHCAGYVSLIGNALSYVRPNDVITLDGVGEWFIQHCAYEFGEQWYRVNTTIPLQFKWPINYSAIVVKLYSTYPKS